ncbi:TPM domain-containing protein [Parafilimonas sp.]|uniref:TPM domain-containing protein n=1 Tax=Parafilimonas sp. TaxID=1969739 RepID=UPI0039E46544
MFSLFKPKQQKFFSQEEEAEILNAIREAEQQTSGEVRLFIESKCRFVDPLDRAAEIFFQLKMNETVNRNAVLVYIAAQHHQLAVFADEGIYNKAGQQFWNDAVKDMISKFKKDHIAEGIAEVILNTGTLLKTHFPYDASTDKNELPDDIVFGK